MIITYTCPECGSDLEETILCTYPPRNKMKCNNCGWEWISESEPVIKIPFDINLNERKIKVVDL